MSCYTRHLSEAMKVVGLELDPAGKREADRRIRQALGLQEAGCPEIWRRLKGLSSAAVAALLAQDQ